MPRPQRGGNVKQTGKPQIWPPQPAKCAAAEKSGYVFVQTGWIFAVKMCIPILSRQISIDNMGYIRYNKYEINPIF